MECARADVVIVERIWHTELSLARAQELTREVRRYGACLIYTIDDQLFALPESIAAGIKSLGGFVFTEELLGAMRYLTQAADGVIVSTARLRETLLPLNDNIEVVPNALDERLWEFVTEHRAQAAPRNGAQKMVLGYMATRTHDADLKMILPALRAILEEYRGRLELELIGGVAGDDTLAALAGLPVTSLFPEIDREYMPFVRWLKQHARWDLAIAPLEDVLFTRCKSDIKFLDYGMLGLAGIYSRVPVYAETVRHLETGYLAENHVDAWYAALKQLLDDDILRRRLGENARVYVEEHRTLQHCAPQWRDAILKIFAKHRPTPKRS
jgi:glycosyltransferase involved in cell wall biosynthesis